MVGIGEARPSGGGEVITIEAGNGRPVEGPFPAALTDQPPLMIGTTIYVITKIGKVTAYDLTGAEQFTVPMSGNLGRTTPLAVAPDGSLRIASTTGRLLALDSASGDTRFDATIEQGVDSPLAVADDGTTYVATSLGRLEGVDASGNKSFDVVTGPLASGPSASADGVVVGDSNGVLAYDRAGDQRFEHPRGARVIGTQAQANGETLAWGEDGVVELLDRAGDPIMSYRTAATNPPPVKANPVVLPSGDIAIIDDSGMGHLVDRGGQALATRDFGTSPAPTLALASNGLVIATFGSDVIGIDFDAE